jgi:outer membrane protein
MLRSCLSAGLITVLCSTALPVAADTVVGVYAGIASWQQEAAGNLASGISDLDIEDDLGMDDETNNMFYIALEHPIPAFPNIRLQHADISLGGANALSRTIEFNGSSFTVAEQVATDIDLTQSDAVLYYELLDNYMTLDLGLAARYVDGYVNVSSTTSSASADFSGVIPMLYGQVRVDLPLTGLWVGVQAQGIAYDGNQLLDANAQVGWESPFGLGVEVGYRAYKLELDEFDEVDSAEIDVEGVYFGLNYHF